jgi:hypothetical protein
MPIFAESASILRPHRVDAGMGTGASVPDGQPKARERGSGVERAAGRTPPHPPSAAACSLHESEVEQLAPDRLPGLLIAVLAVVGVVHVGVPRWIAVRMLLRGMRVHRRLRRRRRGGRSRLARRRGRRIGDHNPLVVFAPRALDDLVELAAIKPNTTTLRAVVDLNTLPGRHGERHGAGGAVHGGRSSRV